MISGSTTSDHENKLLDQIESTRNYLNEMLGSIGAGVVSITPPESFSLGEWMAVLNNRVVELTVTLERYGRK